MNERARFNENGTPPDQRMPAQNSYYFPPASYPRGAQTPPQSHPQPQTFPQGYQEPAYQQGGYQQPGYRQPGYQQPVPPQPYYPQPQYPQPEPAAFATIDDAVAQISARQRALDGNSRPAMPPQPPLPQANHGYGPESYAPPQYRAPACAAPLSPYAAPAYPETPRYVWTPPAPAPDLSGLEAHLRNITAQIETLRQPAPDFSGALPSCVAISPRSARA